MLFHRECFGGLAFVLSFHWTFQHKQGIELASRLAHPPHAGNKENPANGAVKRRVFGAAISNEPIIDSRDTVPHKATSPVPHWVKPVQVRDVDQPLFEE